MLQMTIKDSNWYWLAANGFVTYLLLELSVLLVHLLDLFLHLVQFSLLFQSAFECTFPVLKESTIFLRKVFLSNLCFNLMELLVSWGFIALIPGQAIEIRVKIDVIVNVLGVVLWWRHVLIRRYFIAGAGGFLLGILLLFLGLFPSLLDGSTYILGHWVDTYFVLRAGGDRAMLMVCWSWIIEER